MASACMFWLTTISGIAVLWLALFGGYEYARVAPQSDAERFPYFMAVTALSAAAGLGQATAIAAATMKTRRMTFLLKRTRLVTAGLTVY